MNLENVETLADFAERHELDYPKLRRMARKREFTAPFKFGETWFIDADAVVPVIPERKSRTRSDGRTRFVVYANRETELTQIRGIVGYDNVVDMRDVREKRKLAAAVAAANRVCEHCGETGDPQCWTGTGTCATANAIDV